LEAIASAGAVERRFGHGVDARTVADRAAAYEPDAMRVWREALDALALAIVNYATLLDPEVVVIGGGLANAGPRLFEPLSDLVRASTRFGKPVPIVPAALGEEAGCFGAAIAAWGTVGLVADWAEAPARAAS
jgi:glucokinase